MRFEEPLRAADSPGGPVDFPPVQNGLDYLLSVVEHLAGERTLGAPREREEATPRQLKYAVLHLQAAAEVLLKYRLQQEHWTLVLQSLDLARTRPNKKMTRALFDQGSFVSCGPEETVERLRHLAGVSITDDEQEQLLALAKSRNALQHYGLTDADGAIEVCITAVLEFLVRFLHAELLPRADEADREQADQDMELISSGLNRIEAFVAARMERLKEELAPLADHTVQCPDCRRWALVAGGPTRCLFCPSAPDPWQTAVDYATYVLRQDWRSPPPTGDPFSMPAQPPVEACPACSDDTLVRSVFTAAAPEDPVHLCFACGGVFHELCALCHRPFTAVDEQSRCHGCLTLGTADE